MNHKRGAEWRKWDLHVHTPESIVQFYGGNSSNIWDRFLQEIESLPPCFKVLGINDYLFLDGYRPPVDGGDNHGVSLIVGSVLLPGGLLLKSRNYLRQLDVRQGVSAREIGRLLGVSHSSVLVAVKGFGLYGKGRHDEPRKGERPI